MRTVEINQATGSLAEYVADARREPVILTREGQPYAAIITYEELKALQSGRGKRSPILVPEDGESLLSYLGRVETKYKAEGGIPLEEVELRYGLRR